MQCQLKKLKWPDVHHHRMEAVVLGEDQYGTWLFSSHANIATGPEGRDASLGHDVLSLLPKGEGWWVAAWILTTTGDLKKLWVDIATPVRWTNGHPEYVDLQIDIERLDGSEPEILDVEEFEHHVLTEPYPPSVAAAARDAASFVLERARSYANPFGDAYKTWKGRAGI